MGPEPSLDRPIPLRVRFPALTKGDFMWRPTIAHENGLAVQCLLERDFSQVYTPEVLAYIHRHDHKRFESMLWKQSPEEVAASFSYLSPREKRFLCRALYDQWTKCLAEGWNGLPQHLMEWMIAQHGNA